ncbi:MAG TPA: hypothetical protein VMV69_30510 [Pirellulales bacterium]|nr:hypothetical protein [Pirellulales bacterium]
MTGISLTPRGGYGAADGGLGLTDRFGHGRPGGQLGLSRLTSQPTAAGADTANMSTHDEIRCRPMR